MQQVISAREVLIGPARQHLADGAVLIDGDTISAVGPRTSITNHADPDAVHRHYSHHTLLPGLINCHVHLAFDASTHPVGNLVESQDHDLMPAMIGRAQQALHAGVTTLRDLGDRAGLAVRVGAAVARGELTGPRILASGPPLTPPSGHCWFFGGEVTGPDTIRARIQHNAAMGADVIKVMASGGQMTPDSPAMWASQFDTDQLRLVVEQAAELGLPVAAHAHGTEAIAAAVRAGVDTVEHCTWMSTDGGYDPRDDIAHTMVERGIYACVAWPPRWQSFLRRLGPEWSERIGKRLLWQHEIGMRLIPGTDAGVPHSVFDDFVGSLEFYEHLGFDADTILDMATVTAAEALRVRESTGSLTAGLGADLLVVDGDPRSGIAALRDRRLVLAAGTPIVDVGP